MDAENPQERGMPQIPQFQNPFTNLTKLSKIIAISLICFYILGRIIPEADSIFGLVPGFTGPPHFYVWNLITSGYYENSLINLGFHVVALLLFGKYLEPIWGSREFLKFIILVNALCGVATFFFMVFLYLVSRSEVLWFKIVLCGFSSVLAGFTVAMKQMVPEQEIKLLFAISVRVKSLPLILLLVQVAFFTLGFPSETLPFMFFGIFISWIYLRFFQVKMDTVGDHSEAFSFASFFPEPIQPAMTILSNIIFNLLALCKCCSRTQVTTMQPVDTPDIAERHRARALRALDKRLQQIQETSVAQADISQEKVQQEV